jgi:hypothetical protein
MQQDLLRGGTGTARLRGRLIKRGDSKALVLHRLGKPESKDRYTVRGNTIDKWVYIGGGWLYTITFRAGSVSGVTAEVL